MQLEWRRVDCCKQQPPVNPKSKLSNSLSMGRFDLTVPRGAPETINAARVSKDGSGGGTEPRHADYDPAALTN